MIKKLLLNIQIIWMMFKNNEECNINKKGKILIVFNEWLLVYLAVKNLIQ